MEDIKRIFEDSTEASRYCVGELISIIKNKPDALICLAAGHTSLEFFQMLVDANRQGGIDFSLVRVVGLDEWVGLSGGDDGSCENFLRRNIYDHINVKEENIRLFYGKAADLDEECRSIDAYIEACGGIDYMFLGLGMNGHLALNEPGTDPAKRSHVVMLDTITQQVAVKYFKEAPYITHGITLGIKSILDSRKIHLLITGKKKREIVKKLFAPGKTNMLPGTLLKGCGNAEFIMDEQAAGLLE